MISSFGWSVLVLLFGYLSLFFWGSAIAARAAGKPVWLFGRARGRDRWAAMGFRAAFVLASVAPLLWLVMPVLREMDPFWSRGSTAALGLIGVFVAGIGAMLAFAAQMSMGSSWRVGVTEGATGNLVSDGLYRFSRNPTFVGQFMLLAGISLAVPAIPTILAPLIFFWSASIQVRSEEAILSQALGRDYEQYAATVPRWVSMRRGIRP
ncbi:MULTISPECIES: methyltransferase family protein [Hoeflea]|jgi:protein-S-isoprenylcysteine O-methyltransferase Ste14|uniref:methyltransferase family protein n=1 Tax=Hoeflea TaxID=274591 RepID=UPI000512BF32|nr:MULTISPECIES: methyltransferase [Hoeflea]KGF71039.1 hypothetical protein LL06_01230 [Hoeflea sp. BAL378]MCY0155081.1 DUF1295 domain-containing protein [Hoeflea alexandrii]VVT35373.1 conserved membrane hypothetical protein [Hoeflea sp. EC-HK425]|tara:strand:- start:4709 stop:5332 length:624 start_codon:yes stop_codon:yes gene_type:complete